MPSKTAYRFALTLSITSSLFLLVLIGAVGVIGVEGDPFDRVYFGVVGLGVIGALLTRLEASGMSYVLWAMASAQSFVIVVALAIGKQDSPVSSVVEIVGLNGFFIVLFVGAALLFRQATRGPAASSS